MRLAACGDGGVLVELEDLDQVLAWYAALEDAALEGIVDLVPAARTVLVRFDPISTDAAQIGTAIRSLRPETGRRPDSDLVEIPVRYDGVDLSEVGELTGLGERGVIAAHTEQEWTVAFCGFAPGFGYLVGTDERLVVPRRNNPRTAVPTGAVGLAAEFTGIYPRESPGGWQLIGRTDAPLWDLSRPAPALLSTGTRVHFVEVR